jgi:hypothetical protein
MIKIALYILYFLKFERTKKYHNFNLLPMSRQMMSYTKSILERVSFDPVLFCKELEKAIRMLLPYELEELTVWVLNFTKEKPELKKCEIYLNV